VAHPPAPIRNGNKKPSAAAKGKAKAKAKAKAKSKAKPKKRVCSETPPKTASFKRGKKRHLSPMALKMLAPTKAMRLQKDSVKEALTAASDMAEAEPAEPAETANPAALPAAEPAEPAETAEPAEPAETVSVKLAQVRESIKLLGVPEELLPQSVPKGSGSYTIKHPQHQAAVQVLHARRVYFLTWDRTGAKPPKQTWAWAKHDGAKMAWDLAKKALAW
jgi:hypothetical protein